MPYSLDISSSPDKSLVIHVVTCVVVRRHQTRQDSHGSLVWMERLQAQCNGVPVRDLVHHLA